MAYYEIRLSGSGGQGMMLAGSFLAEAAGIYDDKFIVQTRSYGPESRGGASRSEVIVSSEPIVYPEVTEPDLVLAMTQEASNKYHGDIKPGGVMIIDPDFVKDKPAIALKLYEIPLTRIAREETGKEITANVVALGALAAVVDWVSKDAIKKVILSRAPRGTEALNEKAFEAGYRAGKQQ
jgi:2-oxoglutarate ferredoxin oxidoreductase subunit gamma